jgi:hypothetical protein
VSSTKLGRPSESQEGYTCGILAQESKVPQLLWDEGDDGQDKGSNGRSISRPRKSPKALDRYKRLCIACTVGWCLTSGRNNYSNSILGNVLLCPPKRPNRAIIHVPPDAKRYYPHRREP